MNGKSVEVDNTDAEGRLVLSGMVHFLWIETFLIIPSRRHVLHSDGIQASHFDWRGNTYRVSILFTRCKIETYPNST